MRIAREYERPAVTVSPDANVVDIADQMDESNVGSVVVVDDEHKPLGLITDRDLMVRVVAEGRDPLKTTAQDVMSTELALGRAKESTETILARLRDAEVRRLPLVDDAGRLIGIFTLDDTVFELGVQLWNTAEAVATGLRESARTGPQRRRREVREEAIEDLRHNLSELGEQLRDRIETEVRGLRDWIGGR